MTYFLLLSYRLVARNICFVIGWIVVQLMEEFWLPSNVLHQNQHLSIKWSMTGWIHIESHWSNLFAAICVKLQWFLHWCNLWFVICYIIYRERADTITTNRLLIHGLCVTLLISTYFKSRQIFAILSFCLYKASCPRQNPLFSQSSFHKTKDFNSSRRDNLSPVNSSLGVTKHFCSRAQW